MSRGALRCWAAVWAWLRTAAALVLLGCRGTPPVRDQQSVPDAGTCPGRRAHPRARYCEHAVRDRGLRQRGGSTPCLTHGRVSSQRCRGYGRAPRFRSPPPLRRCSVPRGREAAIGANRDYAMALGQAGHKPPRRASITPSAPVRDRHRGLRSCPGRSRAGIAQSAEEHPAGFLVDAIQLRSCGWRLSWPGAAGTPRRSSRDAARLRSSITVRR